MATVGPIGFIGLMVPHGVRLLVGPSHRALLPLTGLAGAVLTVWADTAARSIVAGQEVPIGVVTAAGSASAGGIAADAGGSTMRISAQGLRWSIDGRPIVADVDVDLEPGVITGVIGPNGSGKTTLLHDLDLAAAFCDRLVVMHPGRIAADGPTAEVLTPELVRRVFGVTTVVSHSDRIHVAWTGLSNEGSGSCDESAG